MNNRGRRAKGRRGEIEIISWLQEIVNEEYQRLGVPPAELSRGPQGKDIRGLSWIAPEVKRHEPTSGYLVITQAQISGWWSQAKVQAGKGQEPVLFYRQNHQPWRIRMYGYIETKSSRVRCPVDISLETFEVWFRQMFRR